MKLLLDENLPHEFRHLLTSHQVFTASYMRWRGVRNGELLARAAAGGFDALISLDAGIQYQQNLSTLPCSVVLLKVPTNRIDDLRRLVPTLLDALKRLTPNTLVVVP
jgi:predicted nuclease of predicted toxin-antitoxin system